MPEPITTVGISAIAGYVGKDLVIRLLGPTADYLGGELKEFTIKRMENLGRIFSNAERKLGDKLNCPGQVPPKVLKMIVNEGSYSDDDISVEYFGGVLASSRTGVNRDDRGARIAKIIDSLSAYQIRSHYLIYATISTLFSADGNSFNYPEHRKALEIFMPYDSFSEAMEFTQQELKNLQLIDHTVNGLSTDGLIDGQWTIGARKSIGGRNPQDGIVTMPSRQGAELFMWAFGHGDKRLDFMLTEKFSAEIEGIPQSVAHAVGTITLNS